MPEVYFYNFISSFFIQTLGLTKISTSGVVKAMPPANHCLYTWAWGKFLFSVLAWRLQLSFNSDLHDQIHGYSFYYLLSLRLDSSLSCNASFWKQKILRQTVVFLYFYLPEEIILHHELSFHVILAAPTTTMEILIRSCHFHW